MLSILPAGPAHLLCVPGQIVHRGRCAAAVQSNQRITRFPYHQGRVGGQDQQPVPHRRPGVPCSTVLHIRQPAGFQHS